MAKKTRSKLARYTEPDIESEVKTKKTLQDVCKEKIHQINAKQRERELEKLNAKYKEEEDAVMVMMYGPYWHQLDLDKDGVPILGSYLEDTGT